MPSTTVLINMVALLYSGLSGAISPLKANRRLNINPITRPWMDE
jgi:hypothetical protein